MLFEAPTLTRVEIYDECAMLLALRDSTAVQELLVRIEGRAPTCLLRSVIQSLRLRSLQLECYQSTVDCPIQEIFLTNSVSSSHYWSQPVHHDVSEWNWFNSLQSLCMSCSSPHHPDYLATLIPLFPNLTQVTIGATGRAIQEEYPLDILHRLSSVRIINARRDFQLALDLTYRVTAFRSCQTNFTAPDLDQLSACRNIRDLALHVVYGAEKALKSLISQLEHLQVLNLRWELPRSNSNGPSNTHSGERRARYSLSSGILSSAIEEKAAPNLKELGLGDVVIFCEELHSIIRNMGRRLNVFRISVFGQPDSPLDRTASILNFLISHCPQLRLFNTADDLSNLRRRDDEELGHRAQLVLRLLERLQQRAPFLNAESFKTSVRLLIDQHQFQQPYITPTNSQNIEHRYGHSQNSELGQDPQLPEAPPDPEESDSDDPGSLQDTTPAV